LQAQISDPLGLTDTFFAATEPVPGGKVDAYQLIEGELLNVSAIDLSSPGTAGAMVSTTRDLARFAEALFGGELLQPATLAEMVTFIPSGRPNLEVGMGVFRWQTPSGALVGNSGDGVGSAARMYRPADTDLTLVLVSNTSDAETVDAVFAEAVRVALESAASNS
jgi:D-alanyl-D-alanine carboxypeptidase